MASVETKLITAEEYLRMPDQGPCELVRGRIVPMNQPGWRHGNIVWRISYQIGAFLDANDVGRAASNDSGVVTARDPDTVRGADILFYSYARLPADQDPENYPELAPEIVWEVLSPTDRWKNVLIKVGEYLEAGVLVVCVIDPKRQCLVSYYPDCPEETLNVGEVWREPTILPGFELPVERVFGK
jgi:Uma2 family endonuclease